MPLPLRRTSEPDGFHHRLQRAICHKHTNSGIRVKIVSMVRILVLTLLLVAALCIPPAEACNCVQAGAPCAQFWRVTAVFAGRVVDMRPTDTPGIMTVRFAVEQRGRGVDSDTVEVASAPQNGTNCGSSFRMGERYVVYAYAGGGDRLTTNMCSGTNLAAQAAADLAFLKEVKGPPRGVRVFGHVRRMEDDLVFFPPGPRRGFRHTSAGYGTARVTRRHNRHRRQL